MLKAFVKTEQLGEKNPEVLVSYPANTDVSDKAHGDGYIVLQVPNQSVISESRGLLPPRHMLADDWRTAAAHSVMRGEAKRRIDSVLPPDDQLDLVIEMVGLLQKEIDGGLPQDGRMRMNEIERLLKYVRDVRARSRNFDEVPNNPSDDSLWPPRVEKRAA